ncbi:hypothetical protein MBM_02187 [Drepanopeziza brunnea f. sp. 'multigermtubi' MB_m1]|uniref:Uncharacterized protein n=1 Tax=Marssonina brunnea f. sp. multigermtubi (strain MB_m1) TaxID=1072389 RepID=K1WRG5_MARBU|nr:uncharacterized protein MBM_02187 [Drepanopeziza brunnea f. sp. 'multigermtubi' MB_m1]EKD20235.1 hypothetical protein MBM_02187 [Drepanopeziza brunnea f. sp. 'multigermtubi' MB_m1]
MPVLAESYPHAAIGAAYLLLAFAVLSLGSLIWRRYTTIARGATSSRTPTTQTSVFSEEKESGIPQIGDQERVLPSLFSSSSSSSYGYPQSSRPPSSLPSLPVIATQDLGVRTQVPDYESPTWPPLVSATESFEAAARGMVDWPKRRSYTETTLEDVEVQGEVVVMAGGWRRHTNVFGGGVCVACKESDRRMR